MMNLVDVIITLKPDVDEKAALVWMAEFSLEHFRKGGNPEAKKQIDYVGWINTNVENGYVKTRISYEYGEGLELLAQMDTPYVEAVQVLWPTDAEGEPIVYAPITWDEETLDIDGNTITVTRTLGGF
jgi:hypothetical protein